MIDSLAKADRDATNPKDLLGSKKPPLHLVPAALLLWVSRIFGFSAKKYGPYNWREKKVIRSIYLDAIDRHLQAMKDGQDMDSESGLPHAAHIAANCAIILDATALGQMVNDMHWRGGPADGLIRQLTEEDKPYPPPSGPAGGDIGRWNDARSTCFECGKLGAHDVQCSRR